MARVTKAAQNWQECARKKLSAAIGSEEESRKKMIETARFVRVPGAMWEGSTNAGWTLDDDRFQKYPRFELNKVGREVDRIITDYRLNRIAVNFRPKDTQASEELADKLNGKFRADFQESNGPEAVDNAYDDGVTGGMGAFRMDTELEDEFDPDNEARHIVFYPIYDPASCLFVDLDSKMYDRSDAMWMAELFSMTPEKYEERYPDALAPEDLMAIDSGKQFDWATKDAIYIARYYEVKIEDTTVISYKNPITGETAVYDEDDIEQIEDELRAAGWQKQKDRKIKRRKVYCGLMTGGEWLEEPKLIPFEWIPIFIFNARRSFIDNQERVSGHATQALDAQRLENLIVSMMADQAAQSGGDNIPIMDIDMIPGKLADAWGERNTKRPAYLPSKSLRNAAGEVVQPAGPLGYTPATPLSPALAAVLQYTGSTIQQIVGSSQVESLPSNLATETVEAIFARMDGQGALYMDNLGKTLRHCGRVYLSASRKVYGSEEYVRIKNEDGTDDLVLMSGKVIDRQTKEAVAINDLKRGKYEVEADVGESSQTKRVATVRSLTNLLQSMGPADPNAAVVMGLIIMNMDGEGLQDFKEYSRRQMLLNGIVKPQTDEEKEMVAQAMQEQQQQPDAEMEAAQGVKMQGQAAVMEQENKRLDLQLKAQSTASDGQLKQAQTVKTMAEAAAIPKDQLMSAIATLQKYVTAEKDDAHKQADLFLRAQGQGHSQESDRMAQEMAQQQAQQSADRVMGAAME
jgi:hypothetical protein